MDANLQVNSKFMVSGATPHRTQPEIAGERETTPFSVDLVMISRISGIVNGILVRLEKGPLFVLS
jgi:hypothetical protein